MYHSSRRTHLEKIQVYMSAFCKLKKIKNTLLSFFCNYFFDFFAFFLRVTQDFFAASDLDDETFFFVAVFLGGDFLVTFFFAVVFLVVAIFYEN